MLGYKIANINFWQIGAPPQQLGTIIKDYLLKKKDPKKIIFLNPKLISPTHEYNHLFEKKVIVIDNFILYLFFWPLLSFRMFRIEAYISDSTHIQTKYNKLNSQYYEKFQTNEIFSFKKQALSQIKKKISYA